MPSEQVAHVSVRQSHSILFNQFELSFHQGPSVHQRHFWELVQDLNDCLCLDFVRSLQVIEQAHEVGHFAGEKPVAFFDKLDDLLWCHSVLAEMAHELVYLEWITAVQVWEDLEDFIDLLSIDLVVDLE